jgi:hypothetical protein
MVLPEFKVARFDLADLPTRVVVEGIDGNHETVWDPEGTERIRALNRI